MKKIFLLFIFLSIFKISFANNFEVREKTWTLDDRRSLCNFVRSQKFMNDATAIVNDNSIIIKPPTTKILLENYKNALASAKLVEKSTLDKAHSEFFKNYEKYKKGLQTRIHSLGNSGSNNESFTSHVLINEFVSWYSSNKKSLQIPIGEFSACRKTL